MSKSFKFVYRQAASVLVLPFLFLRKVSDYVHVSELISLIPFRFGEYVRYEFYKRTLSSCGRNVNINFGTILSYPDITIGSNVWLGPYNTFGHVDIGDYSLTAQGCHFLSGRRQHGFDQVEFSIMKQPGKARRIRIGPDIWVGANATVLANIGRGCIIGAGSVVVDDIPDWAIAVGNPARVIRLREKGRNINNEKISERIM
jgi:virginiamycin A acetyltransferase